MREVPQGLPLFSGLRAAGASAPVWPQAPGARTGGMGGRRAPEAWGARAESMREATHSGGGGDLTCARPQPEGIRAVQVMSHRCRGVFAAGSLGLAEAQLEQCLALIARVSWQTINTFWPVLFPD